MTLSDFCQRPFRTARCIVLIAMLPLLSALTGCYMHAKNGTALDHIQGNLATDIKNDCDIAQKHRADAGTPSAISSALLPPLLASQSGSNNGGGQRFDISVHDVPAQSFFMGLVEGTRYNMVVDPGISGKISLTLKNVTVQEAMDAVRDMYGFEYRRTARGFEVLPETLRTQIFSVNYLDVKRAGESQTQVSSSEISDKVSSSSAGSAATSSTSTPTPPSTAAGGETSQASGSTVSTSSKIDFWKSLEATLTSLVGTKGGRSVVTNPSAGVVVVRAYPAELRDVANYLDHIQNSMERQVIIEAKVLEVDLNDDYQSGIDWGRFAGKIAQTALTGKGNGVGQKGVIISDIPPAGQMFNLSIDVPFRVVINLLEEQGNVQTLSSPRISTLNNQKAVIKVGRDSFFVTSVTSNSTPNTSISNNSVSQSVGLTPFFAGITLDVTPQISSDGLITLHVHPSVSTVKDQVKNIDLGIGGELSLPLAESTIRESDTMVHARSGQVIVIGGLMQSQTEEKLQATPGMSKIPFFGTLFRNTNQHSIKSELVILLQPCFVNDNTWTTKLQESSERFHELRRGFHAGSLPNTFGTMGEKPNS